jgi:3-oxoacyl-[acyl-carrier protein] reductase
MTSRRHEGRAIFITGASRGIGRATALACAREGVFVGVGYHKSADCADAAIREIHELGGRAEPYQLDVAAPADVERAVTSFAETAGRLDALVANAGVLRTGLLATADPAELEGMILANVLGPIASARAALPIMLRERRGVLLFVGSVAASRPARGQAAYAASKASVEALCRALAVEYGRKGIRSICLRPGAVATEMLEGTQRLAEDEVVSRIPMRRIATADEVARVAVMLLSDDASYVNGAVVDVDGGYGAG